MRTKKRYKFIFQGRGNCDLKGAKEVLIIHGIKWYKKTINLRVRNK